VVGITNTKLPTSYLREALALGSMEIGEVMKVFNEEIDKKAGQVVLVLEAKEANELLLALDVAIETNKRKTIWKSLRTILWEKAVMF